MSSATIKQIKASAFKRKALGLCRRKAIKSLEELAKILYDLNVTPNLEEAKQLVPTLAGGRWCYGKRDSGGDLYATITSYKILAVDKIKDSRGNDAYKIYNYEEFD